MPAELTWYVLRATGIVAWLLLTTSVVGGLALRTKLLRNRVRPPWLLDLHRGLAALAVVFTTIHVVAVVVDPWIDFTWVHALVPFTSEWRPLPIAAGVLALHLLAAIQVTSLLQRRVGVTWWRRVHITAVPCWLLATGHLITAGTDATNVLLGVGVLAAVGAVTFPFTLRLLQPRRRAARRTADREELAA
jgi:predicted ferric reductase